MHIVLHCRYYVRSTLRLIDYEFMYNEDTIIWGPSTVVRTLSFNSLYTDIRPGCISNKGRRGIVIEMNKVQICTWFRLCKVYNTIVIIEHAVPDFEILTT